MSCRSSLGSIWQVTIGCGSGLKKPIPKREANALSPLHTYWEMSEDSFIDCAEKKTEPEICLVLLQEKRFIPYDGGVAKTDRACVSLSPDDCVELVKQWKEAGVI